ncbi:MAG: indole-3-glycerol phosphate synthase [Sulfurovum sp. 39-42-12]|jgi:indole-3-glycerol phosphate synthase|nr:MAG: indole-3-glycerol phosphate synthase [Sulfurovum sp. 35-42-20]OYZ26007.1 MAG: indole-3-glycerol phosphate synthase [Sulfurovum sp. 16-42-52]OYZ49183.1 MAG: indole-3-glycerol phosphate synthase [Sulfurovum sp. 24-42-9]OZA46057.1 MAG: indole-3-glycerol phosphate synthase [Sulfurovum sp. 17-42-90]OZA59695.1 MAG: indole-3-glycerol phosphate synthase [Sulfurovum sp. 39-42-12]HQR73908.1 indole-3-glycerol phosphate synthase TrpC [Sulfurovum sp.]
MAQILDEILKKTRADLEKRKVDYPLEWLGRSLAFNPFMPKDVKSALRSTPENPYRIIAEVKKASPSKGVIREDFDPMLIAQQYEKGGADSLSILTEPHFFQGDKEYLGMVRRYVNLPLLRKDFIVDKYQLVEALAFGADYVLLIAAALGRKELKELYDYALHLGLDVLVEVHDKSDLIKATFAGADIIGINHRNLETFEMDMSLSAKLIPLIPNGKIIVAESGITTYETVVELSKIGADAFLVGEHFMRQADVTEAVRALKYGV